jgi:YHS domain-containing protein
MEKLTFKLVVTIILTFLFVNGYAQPVNEGKEKSSIVEANVRTGEDGSKYYKCPVMGNEGVVDSTTTFSVVDGKQYFYCCAGCSEKLQANPSKYLKKFVKPGGAIKIDKDEKCSKSDVKTDCSKKSCCK